MKKTYQTTKTETIRIKPMGLMIPASDPADPNMEIIP